MKSLLRIWFLATAALFAVVARASVELAPNNTAIKHSNNWNVTSGAMTTINAGAYFKFKWRNDGTPSAVPVLHFDISKMPSGSDASQLWVQVDYEPKWTKVALTSADYTAVLPTETATGVKEHIVRVIVKSTSENVDRWNVGTASTNTAVKFTGATLPDGTYINNGQPFGDYDFEAHTLAHRIAVFGDSLDEGVRAITASGPSTYQPDDNDSMAGWGFPLGESLGAEVDVIGFGSLGWTRTGSGNVPPFPSSWNFLYAGVSRSLSGYDLIVINMGTNDAFVPATLTGIVTPVLNGMRTAAPGVPILIVTPKYSDAGYYSTFVSEVAAMTDPSGVSVFKFPNSAFGDPFNQQPVNAYEDSSTPIHPLRLGNRERVVPAILGAIESLISGYYPQPSGAYPTGLHYLGRHVIH